MPHIHTEPGQHDATASAFIIRTDTAKPSLILHKHRLLKAYLQFGGHIELNENPWQAIIHEITEESGYTMHELKLLQPPQRIKHLTGAVLHPAPFSSNTHKFGDLDHYHTDWAYAFTASGPPTNHVGAGESEEMELFDVDALQVIPRKKIPENVRESGLFVMQEILNNWEPVDPVTSFLG